LCIGERAVVKKGLIIWDRGSISYLRYLIVNIGIWNSYNHYIEDIND
jgi:hypothetical protein